MYLKATKDPDRHPAEWVHIDDLDDYAQDAEPEEPEATEEGE